MTIADTHSEFSSEPRRVALVTGASRGAGAGIARALGSHGLTVYVTGRSTTTGSAIGWDGKPLPGTIFETAEAVSAAGGVGIPLQCDHSDDQQVAGVFERIQAESGRLDILVNNATFIHEQLIEPKPFWEKSLDAVNILDVGLRSGYVASWHAAKMMVPQGSGLIVFGSSFGANCYMHGAAYGAQKAGVDKMAFDMDHDLRETGVRALSIWMGPLKTERALKAADVHPEQYEAFMAMAETPEFTGHLIHALAFDERCQDKRADVLVGAELALELSIDDNGFQPPSHRDMLGGPPPRSSAAVY